MSLDGPSLINIHTWGKGEESDIYCTSKNSALHTLKCSRKALLPLFYRDVRCKALSKVLQIKK